MNQIPRLSPVEREILVLLTAKSEMYGLELVEGSDKLKLGTVYVTLGRMEAKGWLASRQDLTSKRSGLPQRLYTVLAPGRRTLRAVEAIEAFMTTAEFKQAIA